MRIKPPTEAAFTRAVIGLARLCGFKVAHFRPARVRRGGREPGRLILQHFGEKYES